MSSSPGQARRYRVGRCWLGTTVWVIVGFGGETHDRRATTIHSATQYSAVPCQALLQIWTFFRRACQTGGKRRTPAGSRVSAREPFPPPRNEQTLVLAVSKNRSPWLETPSLPDGIPGLVDPETTGYDPKRPLWIHFENSLLAFKRVFRCQLITLCLHYRLNHPPWPLRR